MKMICKNQKCKYEWDYRGKHLFWVTCPRCLRKISMHDNNEYQKQVKDEALGKKEMKIKLANIDTPIIINETHIGLSKWKRKKLGLLK